MKESLVSIIIPCFNGEHFIDRAIASVFEQDWELIELIVVNDGSTDESKKHILSWKSRMDARGFIFKYIEQQNRGPGGAIDTGLKSVTGKYLMLLDADDRFLAGAVKDKAEFLDNNLEYALVRSNGWVVSGENRWLFTNEEYEKDENLFDLLLSGKTFNWAGSYMLRTEILFGFYTDRKIFPSRFGQNLQLLLPVAYKRKCGFIDKPQMEYIRQPVSLSRGENNNIGKEKALKNAEGYHEIRVHVLNDIHSTSAAKREWVRMADAIMYRMKLSIAVENMDSLMVREMMRQLRETSLVNLDDLIAYYTFFHNPIATILKGARRVTATLERRRSKKVLHSIR